MYDFIRVEGGGEGIVYVFLPENISVHRTILLTVVLDDNSMSLFFGIYIMCPIDAAYKVGFVSHSSGVLLWCAVSKQKGVRVYTHPPTPSPSFSCIAVGALHRFMY